MKKTLWIVLGLALVAVVTGWVNRFDILLYVASLQKKEIAPHRAITWAAGDPATRGLDKPNVILILLDDVGINDTSLFGGGMIPTPNIDRLAAEGVLFDTAYAGTATCAPSRGMVMTGRYPVRTGFEFTPLPDGMGKVVTAIGNNLYPDGPPYRTGPGLEEGIEYEDQGLPTEEITIAEVMKGHGYRTMHIGKWHLGRRQDMLPNAQGFDDSLMMASGLYMPEGHPKVVNAKLPFDPIDQFLWAILQYAASFNGSDWFMPKGYLTDYYTDEALNAIEANRDNPFFLYLAHWGVHTPLQALSDDMAAVPDFPTHRQKVYAAMIHSLDRSVGRIMDKLEEQGLADNTAIILTSDNGGAHYVGLPDVNAPYRGWKITGFEGGLRVPFVMRWPRALAAGQVIDEPVAHIDLMPTIAAIGGASLPEDRIIDGQNLVPLASGAGNVARQHDALYWSSGFHKIVRQDGWKLQVNEKMGKAWLFDLNTDPTEQVNLVDARADKHAALQSLIDQHWGPDAKPPLYQHFVEAPIFIDKHLAEPTTTGDEYVYWPN